MLRGRSKTEMTENELQNKFYDHFAKDQPTKFGMKLVRVASKNIFNFAEAQNVESILEIGPGRGAFANICLEQGIEYWAIEPNQQMADELEKRGAKVLRTLVPPLPEMQRNFDLIVMSSVLEHMDTMNMALTLSKQVYKILNPNGKFVIYCPDYINWKHHFFLTDFSHNYVTTWRRVDGLLTSAGFENIKGTYTSGPLKGFVSILTSCIARLLPFGQLHVLSPKNKIIKKLYKLQVSFLRGILISGQKAPSQQPGKTVES